jgi:ATP-binding cassette subfamily B protein
MREPRSAAQPKVPGRPERVDPKSLQPLKRLLPFVLRYPVRLALTLLFLLIAATTSLSIPAIAGRIVDEGFIRSMRRSSIRTGWAS